MVKKLLFPPTFGTIDVNILTMKTQPNSKTTSRYYLRNLLLKNRLTAAKLLLVLSLFGSLLILQSCFAPRVYTSYDPIRKIKRTEIRVDNNVSANRQALSYIHPFVSSTKTFVKEVDDNNESFTVFELLVLHEDSYPLSDTMFILVGENTYPIKLNNMETNFNTYTENTTSDILASDSTKVSVVTGSNTYNRKKIKMSYTLSPDLLNQITKSNDVKFVYYAKPSVFSYYLNYQNQAGLLSLLNAE